MLKDIFEWGWRNSFVSNWYTYGFACILALVFLPRPSMSCVAPAFAPRIQAMMQETIVRVYNGPRCEWCERMPHSSSRGIVNLGNDAISSSDLYIFSIDTCVKSADLTPIVDCRFCSVGSVTRQSTLINVSSTCETNSFHLKYSVIFISRYIIFQMRYLWVVFNNLNSIGSTYRCG